MTIKHTPGPWRVQTIGIGRRQRAFIECDEVRDEEQEETWLAELAAGPRWEADARLMAAAPDLLSALKISLDEHYATWMAARAEVEGSLMSKQLFDMEPGVIAARAAIKRAREG